MNSARKATAVYSAAHFFVDFACAFWFFLMLDKGADWMLYILLYNFFAFACQMLIGVLADGIGRNRIFAVLGLCFVALSPAIGGVPIALCIVLGLGNALFHVGAGRDVLCRTKGYSSLGVFVSPGAIGLFLGTLLAKAIRNGTDANVAAVLALAVIGITAVMVLLGLLIFFLCREKEQPSIEKTSTAGVTLFPIVCVAALFLVVVLRSYVGGTLAFPWKDSTWALVLVFALALGKTCGGFLADRFGDILTSVVTLVLSAGLFFLWEYPVCGVLAVFFFNMTMPITLGAVCRFMPRHKGLGFGLLTFGLFVGVVPLILGAEAWLVLPYGFSAACMVSALLLALGLRGAKKWEISL